MRLMSFNIHGGKAMDGKRDISRINHLIQELDVDIAIFQEVETRISRGGTTEDVKLLAGSHEYLLPGPSIVEPDGWYGNLIVSRYPILRGLVHNLETKPQFEPRNAVDALLDTPYGNIRIIGTHLSLSYLERRAEARNLLRLMKAVEEKEVNPIILAGDINEWQVPSKLLNFLDDHMTQVRCRPSFPSGFPIFRLDRIWFEGAMTVSAKVLSDAKVRHLSDHLPLIAEITFD